ncbi:hypothetical protein V8B97DRAFT_1917663 [Scleroderma yunnanense]
MPEKHVAWLQLCISCAPRYRSLKCMSDHINSVREVFDHLGTLHLCCDVSEGVWTHLWDDSDTGSTDPELDNTDALHLLQLTLVKADKEAEFLFDPWKENGMDGGAQGSTVDPDMAGMGGGVLNGVECIEELRAVGGGASIAGIGGGTVNLDAAKVLVHLPPGWKMWAPWG